MSSCSQSQISSNISHEKSSMRSKITQSSRRCLRSIIKYMSLFAGMKTAYTSRKITVGTSEAYPVSTSKATGSSQKLSTYQILTTLGSRQAATTYSPKNEFIGMVSNSMRNFVLSSPTVSAPEKHTCSNALIFTYGSN